MFIEHLFCPFEKAFKALLSNYMVAVQNYIKVVHRVLVCKLKTKCTIPSLSQKTQDIDLILS